MQAVIRRGANLVCAEIDAPEPGPGQALLRTRACGICGSDLHALHHVAKLGAVAQRNGVRDSLNAARDLVFGHEFCGEIVGYGPGGERAFKEGARVVAMPRATGPNGPETVGFSHRFPGAYGELVVVDDGMLIAAPEALSDVHAAMTEPFAVGAHAVARARLDESSVCVVIGCGAVGLAVIAALKVKGIGPVIAADYSPARRKTAEAMGADIVVDPAVESPFGRWESAGVLLNKFARETALQGGARVKNAVIFECVGVPGVIRSVIEGAAPATQIIVVGVCMEEDRFEPYQALTKELTISFSSAYTFGEFRETLDHIAAGRIRAAPLVSSVISRGEVAAAFEALAAPDAHVKIVIDARRG